MASVASQLIEEVTAHAQSDSPEDVREICADSTYFPNNLRTWIILRSKMFTDSKEYRHYFITIRNITVSALYAGKGKGKGKVSPVAWPWRHTKLQVYLYSFVNLGVKWTPRRGCFTPRNDPVTILHEVGWAPGSVRTCVENLAPTGIRSPDSPARSESCVQCHMWPIS